MDPSVPREKKLRFLSVSSEVRDPEGKVCTLYCPALPVRNNVKPFSERKPASFPIEKIESIIRLRAMSSHTRELNCTKEMKYKRKKSKVERKQVEINIGLLQIGFFTLHSEYFVAISV